MPYADTAVQTAAKSVVYLEGEIYLPDASLGPLFEPVEATFELSWMTKMQLRRMTPSWSKLGEVIFYRTYSREILAEDGETVVGQESLADVISRVIEGTFSIRKDHYRKHDLPWDETAMQLLAHEMAISAFKGEWGPPGRGYWAMGTPDVYAKGGFRLHNCAFCDVKTLSRDAHWVMDALMLGCVTDDTWVSTSFGPRQVKDLIGRPFVAYVDGKPCFSRSGFFRSGEKSTITIDAQGHLLTLTRDHQMLTPRGWVEAGNLAIGDEIVLGDPGLASWDGEGTEDEGYLMGLLIGDGHFSIRRGEVRLDSYEPEEEAAAMRHKVAEIVLGLEGRADRRGWQWVPSDAPPEHP